MKNFPFVCHPMIKIDLRMFYLYLAQFSIVATLLIIAVSSSFSISWLITSFFQCYCLQFKQLSIFLLVFLCLQKDPFEICCIMVYFSFVLLSPSLQQSSASYYIIFDVAPVDTTSHFYAVNFCVSVIESSAVPVPVPVHVPVLVLIASVSTFHYYYCSSWKVYVF